jgi:hypothetical protein
MDLQIENVAKQVSKEGRTYFTFALTLIIPGEGFVTGKGWRYFPSTGNLGSPKASQGKGRSKIVTQWLGGALYERVRQKAQEHFVSKTGLCPPPWESQGDKKETSEEMSEEERSRLEMIACSQFGVRTQEQFEEWLEKRKKKNGKRRNQD